MSLEVFLSFVDISSESVDPFYYACGDPTVAGPFMSGGSAIDWRDQFCPTAQVFSRSNAEDGVCTGPAILRGENGWYRY